MATLFHVEQWAILGKTIARRGLFKQFCLNVFTFTENCGNEKRLCKQPRLTFDVRNLLCYVRNLLCYVTCMQVPANKVRRSDAR